MEMVAIFPEQVEVDGGDGEGGVGVGGVGVGGVGVGEVGVGLSPAAEKPVAAGRPVGGEEQNERTVA